MVKTIETKAIISAADQTGNTFGQIAQKLRQMEAAAKTADKTVARAASVAKNAPASVVSNMRTMGGLGLNALGVASMVRNAVGAVAAGAAVHHIISQGAKQMHEKVRMEASGMSSKELQEATTEAAKLSAKFPVLGQTELMHMMRNARAIVGSYKEAAEIMEPLAKLRVIAQANRPGQDVSEDFDQLVKGLEIKGVTQHPKQFQNYMEGIAKGLNVFGDTLKPYQYYEMFKYGRQATPGLSERFILSTAPTLAQEMGGSSFGKAVSAFNAAMVNGVMKHSSAVNLDKLGLVDHSLLDKKMITKTGEIKGLSPGSVRGWRLAQSDPDLWLNNYLIPAMEKRGITSNEDQLKTIGGLFANQIASQFVGILTTQRSRVAKDAALLDIGNKTGRGAPGLSAAELYLRKDPTIAWQSFKVQADNVGAHMGVSFAHAAAPILNNVAKSMGNWSKRMAEDAQHRLDHPGEDTPSQARFNRWANKTFLGVDSDAHGLEIPESKMRDARVAAERERRARLGLDMGAAAAGLASEGARPGEDSMFAFGHGPRSRFDRQHGFNLERLARARGHMGGLDDLNWATLQRMLVEQQLGAIAMSGSARTPLFGRVSGSGMGSTVPPGLLAFGSGAYLGKGRGMAMDYSGVPSTVPGGVKPVVALPPGMSGEKKGAEHQKVDVDVHAHADPLNGKIDVQVTASSSLLEIVNSTKQIALEAKMAIHAAGQASGPGSKGSTDAGLPQQH